MEINQPVPDFELPDMDGKLYRLSDYRGKIVIVNFWSCECPHSERTDGTIMSKLTHWGADVVMLTIAANRNESAGAVKEAGKMRGLPVVLLDADCRVADLFEAQATPHVFIVDREQILRYRGAVDNVTFRQRAAIRFFLDEAVESLMDGRLPNPAETLAYGCAIVRMD
jgi:peroxiredoxin